jgi:lysophospholipase L1-like esterase
VVINIGTNNLSGTSHARANVPEEIVEGIVAVCNEVHERSPESGIVLMDVFPRGRKADNPFRPSIRKINELLAQRFAGDHTVTMIDIGPQFLAADGTLREDLMPDATHPSDAGYQIWADALLQLFVQSERK